MFCASVKIIKIAWHHRTSVHLRVVFVNVWSEGDSRRLCHLSVWRFGHYDENFTGKFFFMSLHSNKPTWMPFDGHTRWPFGMLIICFISRSPAAINIFRVEFLPRKQNMLVEASSSIKSTYTHSHGTQALKAETHPIFLLPTWISSSCFQKFMISQVRSSPQPMWNVIVTLIWVELET